MDYCAFTHFVESAYEQGEALDEFAVAGPSLRWQAVNGMLSELLRALSGDDVARIRRACEKAAGLLARVWLEYQEE